MKAEKAREVAANTVLAVTVSPYQSGRSTPQTSQSLFSPSDGENNQATFEMIEEVISQDSLAIGLHVDEHTVEVETTLRTVSGITTSNKEISMNIIAIFFCFAKDNICITFIRKNLRNNWDNTWSLPMIQNRSLRKGGQIK